MRILPDGSVPGMILPALARWAAEESHVLADEGSPFHADLVPGDPRVLLIVGENASGKSLAFRLIAQLAGTHGAVPITISIRERTGAGSDGHERMRRVFMFGDEEQSSTGATSAGVVVSGFSNLDRDKPAILGLDEPEIGLSDGYAEALGELIGQRATITGPLACGVMVVTHSRRLATGIVKGLGCDPTLLTMSEPHASVSDWIASDERRSVDDLMNLKETGVERWRTVERMLKR